MKDEGQANRSGMDEFQAPGSLDIPRVNDIPVVSKLARISEEQKLKEMNTEEVLEYKKKKNLELMRNMVSTREDAVETHFVDNPYISKRVKAKGGDSSIKLGEAQLTGN
jgi:hypothetical protein